MAAGANWDFSLANQLRVHTAIEGLYPRINAAGKPLGPKEETQLVKREPISKRDARLRVAPGALDGVPEDGELQVIRLVWRDPIIAALVSKAAATKRAVVSLVQSDLGTDAYALCRSLLEAGIIIHWLLHKDEHQRKQRIDTYILHFEAFSVKAAEAWRDFHKIIDQELPPHFGYDDRTRQISADVFDDRWEKWAWVTEGTGKRARKRLVSIREMINETGIFKVFAKDYMMMSVLLHSAPASVMDAYGAVAPASRIATHGYFVVDPDLFKSKLASMALIMSNVIMLSLLSHVTIVYEIDLENELSAIRDMSVSGSE